MPKLYYGIRATPKGKTRADMEQSAKHNQLRRFGLYKVDPQLVEDAVYNHMPDRNITKKQIERAKAKSRDAENRRKAAKESAKEREKINRQYELGPQIIAAAQTRIKLKNIENKQAGLKAKIVDSIPRGAINRDYDNLQKLQTRQRKALLNGQFRKAVDLENRQIMLKNKLIGEIPRNAINIAYNNLEKEETKKKKSAVNEQIKKLRK